MATDIVMPDGNEEEFIRMRKKLGFDNLIFLYSREPKERQGRTALLADSPKQLKGKVNKFDLIISPANPWSLSDKRIGLIFGLEDSKRDDFMHHRSSGLNQVIAKQLAQNNTRVVFNFSRMFDEKKRDVFLGRMAQNVEICRKYGVKMVLATFAVDPYEMRAAKDLEAFGRMFGMQAKEAKQALEW